MTTNLNQSPPRVFSRRTSPAYPRVLGLAALLLAGACSRAPSDAVNATPDRGDPSDAPPAPAGSPGPIMAETPADAAAPSAEATDAATPDSTAPDAASSAPRRPPQPPPPPRRGGVAPHPFDPG